MKLSNYILLPREVRTSHINLSTPCVVGKKWRKSVFLDYLDVEDDIDNWKDSKIERCHLCECHSRNGNCVNPEHVYIGTTKENASDRPQDYLIESGRRLGSAPKSDVTRKRMSESAKNRTDNRTRKPVQLERISDKKIYYFNSQKEAAETLNLSRGLLSRVVSGQIESTKGFRVYSKTD